MSFSQGVQVKLANGSTKNINQIEVGDCVLNIFNKPTLVKKIITTTSTSFNTILSNNTSASFYVNPSCEVRCCFQTDGNTIINWETFQSSFDNEAKLKKNKFLVSSNESTILSFVQDNTPRTLYNLQLEKKPNNYIVNNFITKGHM